MKNNIIVWVKAARLRTLPLSFSGIITGTALAFQLKVFNSTIFVLSLLTTFLFQVLSNFANDYGDGVKGTDNDARIGPKRILQSDLINRKSLKSALVVLSVASFLSAFALLYFAFKDEWIYYLIFLGLTLLSIWAAIAYTVGNSAYGYKGLGDLFVFLFFGLLAVLGSQFLYTQNLRWMYVLPAITIGLLATAVLNLNNLRDEENDRSSGKKTLIVIKGFNWGKKYHEYLIYISFLAAVGYTSQYCSSPLDYIHLIAFIPLFVHLNKVKKTQSHGDLDTELKKVALSTFGWSLLFLLSFL
jgi:1,4-dihydroxy-2-naphthoate octaprenyltransferase